MKHMIPMRARLSPLMEGNNMNVKIGAIVALGFVEDIPEQVNYVFFSKKTSINGATIWRRSVKVQRLPLR